MRKRYQQVLDQYGLDSSAIEIELTETGSLTSNDYQHIKNMIEQFREKQFRTAQAGALKKIGCEEGQGYWFARPMPMEDFEKMMEQETGNCPPA